MNLLFESEEERIATEKVLAAYKVKSLNENIDNYIADILKYAMEIDNLLEANDREKRYMDRVSSLSDGLTIALDEDLENLDFRVKEVVEDYIMRINTRIGLINNCDNNIKTTEANYDIKDLDMDKEIELAKLSEENFA